jgi:hypothetical protein
MSNAKLRSIERAKARYAANHPPEKLQAIRDAYSEDKHDRTLAALAEYGRASSEAKELQAKLDLADRAEQKGYSRGLLTSEQRARIEKSLTAARGRAEEAFKQHVQGLTDEEANSFIQGIEKPAYKQIGQALQLHKLLRDDPIVKVLKQALDEDISEKGLSELTKVRLREILGDQNIGNRLSRGASGQRTRIYDMLGRVESDQPSLKLLKFLPDMDRARQIEASLKSKLDTEVDPSKRAQLQDSLFAAQERVRKFQDIHDKVEGARKFAAEMAANETDPKKRAFYERLSARNETQLSERAEAQQRLSRLQAQYAKETDIYQKAKLSRSIQKLEQAIPSLPDTVEAPKGEYKLNPILVKPKYKGKPMLSKSEFFNADLPGQFHEISLDNLAAILGKEKLRSKTGELTPEQKSLLRNAASAEERRNYRAQFVRDRVQQLRDDAITSVRKQVELVKKIKEIRGIPPDHLTPLETKLADLSDQIRRGDTVAKAPAGLLDAAHPQPQKPPQTPVQSMPESSQAEKAVTPTLTPAEAATHERVKGLEKTISKADPEVAKSFDTLRKAAEEIGKNRADKYLLYENSLRALQIGIEKGDPWAMFNAMDSAKRPSEIGTLGPSRRNLSPDQIKDSYRVYAHLMLQRYEGMTDLAQARLRDRINDGILARAVKESGDQNVKDRFLVLVDKVGTNDPVQAMGNALINGQKISPKEAAQGLMRNRLGEMKLDKIRLRKTVEDAAARWDKAHVADSVDFIDAMEKGDLSKFSPEDQALGKTLRDLLDDRRNKLQALGKDFLKTYIQDYFPHLWSNVGKASKLATSALARRPLAGEAGFLKGREYDTFKEGLAAGLQPATWNPVKMALLRIDQIDKFLAAHKMADDFKKNGFVKFVRIGGEVPVGWVEMNDKIFRAEKLNPKSGALMSFGKYYAPKEVATAFNNHLSPGLHGNAAYDIIRNAGNAVNQANLLGGVFHLIESGFNTTVSDLALSLKAGFDGQFKTAAKSLARMPVSVVDAYFNSGKKMMAEAMSPGKYAEYARSVDYMKRAGGTLQIDPDYLNQSMEKFRTNLKTVLDPLSPTKNRALAGAKLPVNAVGTLLEKANWFVMEHFVPRMKAAVFHRMAQQIYEKMGNNPNEHLLNKEVDDAWDSVDNRLGELVYDNLFWNRAVKDMALVTFRSTGWNLGTAREIGGGAMDVGERIRRRVQGESGLSLMSHRTAYTIALTGSVMGIGAAMTYLSTGHGPQSATDYFYPPDGTYGPDGKPNRQYLKTYIHDVNSLLQHPLSTVTHKASPLWSQAYDVLWANADFYGREIRHPDDSPVQQDLSVLKYVGKSILPFVYQNITEENRRDATRTSKIEAALGILPAPRWAGQSKAESLAEELTARSLPQGPRDKDAFDRAQEIDALRNRYAHGHSSIEDIMKSADEGKIRYKDIEPIISQSRLTPLQRQVSSLSPRDALRVWDAATPDERDKLDQIMWKKFEKVYEDYGPDDVKSLERQFVDALVSKQQTRPPSSPGRQ